MKPTLSDRLRLHCRAWKYRMKEDPVGVRHIARRLRRGDTAVDIGAYKGAYTYWMQKAVGKSGRVLAFEPQAEMADELNNTARSRGWTQVEVIQAAVSDANGEGSLCIPASSPRHGAHLIASADAGDSTVTSVPLVSLDSALEEMGVGAVHFIKCDVEGNELAVFHGARRTLERHHPVLHFECEVRHQTGHVMQDAFAFLHDAGYQGFFPLSGKLRPLGEFDADRHQRPGVSPYVNNFIFEARSPARD